MDKTCRKKWLSPINNLLIEIAFALFQTCQFKKTLNLDI